MQLPGVCLSHPASRCSLLLGLLLKAQWPDFDQVLHGSATLSAEHGLVLQVKQTLIAADAPSEIFCSRDSI